MKRFNGDQRQEKRNTEKSKWHEKLLENGNKKS